MGGGQSQEAEPEIDLQTILEENTYYASSSSKYPYFLVQLSENDELEYKGKLVSDAIAEYIKDNDITHIIAQTHGWNTPPDKAVAVPFTEFIGGMQNDAAMPSENFNPIFVAFIWPAVPIEFGRAPDALTRLELLKQNEKQLAGEDTDIVKAAEAAELAIEEDNDEKEELVNELKMLAANARDDDDDDDEDPDTKVQRVREEARSGGIMGGIGDAVSGVAANVLNPFQHLVFGRLMKRGNRTGKVMEKVLGKLMRAKEGTRIKLCLMANSLGAHVLTSVLNNPQTLPYKAHTVFFVQGAITRDWFDEDGKFAACRKSVAGPIVCTHSQRDLMLKNVYAFFHGEAIGLGGVNPGAKLTMKSLDEANESPYEFSIGDWNSVDGTAYVYLRMGILVCFPLLFYLGLVWLWFWSLTVDLFVLCDLLFVCDA